MTRVNLLVSEHCSVEHCTIDETSGAASLDAMTSYALALQTELTLAIGVD